MQHAAMFIELDVHKATISVGVATGLLHYSSEWIHLTGSVSYSPRHVEALCSTLPHVELVPLQRRSETARLPVHLV